MTDRPDITPAIASQALEYNSDAGVYTWKKRPRSHFISDRAMNIWNARYPGTVAGKRTKENRLTICIMGKPYLAYRLAFAIMTGKWPSGEIDHINGDPSDDRWINLREASHQQNAYNQRRSKNNTTGHKGVVRNGAGRYQAAIMANGKRSWLGTFDTAEEAHEAYCKAAAELHGEFARLA